MSPPAPALPLSSGTGDRNEIVFVSNFWVWAKSPKSMFCGLPASAFDRTLDPCRWPMIAALETRTAVTISCVIERVWTLPVLLNLILLVTLYVQKVDRICNVQVYPDSFFTFLRFVQWWGYLLLLAKSRLCTNRQKGSDTSVHPVGLATKIFSSRVCYRYWFSL